MPRGPRIDAPGAVHHVILRGIERRPIFLDERDRSDFLRRLGRVLPECGTRCFAWALMPNHVHMVLRTGHRPLATAMARVNTGYAGWFNRRYDRAGYLFQGRYQSILVEHDAYLFTLVRYVHLNPVKAGIVASPSLLADYPWTGHAVLMGRRQAAFQSTKLVLAEFGRDRVSARTALDRWMCEEEPPVRPDARPHPEAVLERLVARACRELGVDSALLDLRPPASATLAAREWIAAVAHDTGVSSAVVARRLGMSLSALSRARRRAARARTTD